MFDLTTIGEGQIRLTVQSGDRLVTANQLRMTAACSEANVAGLLSELGRETSWCSKLPKGQLSRRIMQEFRSVGVDMSNMLRAEEGRVALYFMEPGKSPMPSKVVYDRLHTPFRDLKVDEINWESMLDTKLIFVTGITAALTENTAKVVRYFCDQAHERGISIALDVNYRSLLWSPEQARETLEPIAKMSDLLFVSHADSKIVFDMPEGEGVDVCRAVREKYEVPTVVSTNGTRGVYLSDEQGDESYEVEAVPIVDRPGAGDSFVAGTIHGYLDGDVRAGVCYGQRVSKYALTHHGDLTRISPSELQIPITSDIIR
ncbi:2-keto-3-deoxygluconate kinase [Corynebacterium phocae]|uniref:2-keto-3-deoxygluconate kinase n=1 Tax=Corynebacterium phocae TaxID=161895 RepID=A0A1L7D1T1_9CORY|nr:sugar kinase [Corynebacterium phocae]APT91982.1 2-keto-3-deoxygluconate kinase [Corynebacterium phocae]KAA8726977.1 sugar kinase [Corynebacterium phocae]